MNKNFIAVNTPLLNGNEKKYLDECIDGGWISSEGPFVKRFEELFAKRVNRQHGISVCNGTVALELAVKCLDIKEGDEVIMPSFTIISCAAAVIRNGAIPVFVDSNPVTWNMDIESIEGKITTKTKAIMVVHIYGLPVDMDPVIQIAKKYGLLIIEDAAQMHGQNYRGQPCGSFGVVSCFSFYPNKHITTGEGGMVVTNDDNLAEKLKHFRNLCFIPEQRFIHYDLGWNFRFTNIQAALGLAQLEQLDDFVIKKRKIGKTYNDLFKDIEGIQLPLEKTDYADNIYWVYGIVISASRLINSEKIMEFLAKEGIGTRPFFYPMHKQPVFKGLSWFKQENLVVSEDLYTYGFYIPSGLALTQDEQTRVGTALHKILHK